MAAIAGRKARVRVPGAALAFTNEAATGNGARTQYQIANAAKRVFDPTVGITVQTSPDGVTWTTASPATYSLNRLTGTVTFGTAQAAGTQVRFSAGSYWPLTTVAGAKQYSVSMVAQQQNDTDFDGAAAANGFGSKLTGQYDASGTLLQWHQGTGDTFFENALMAATVVVLELMADRSAAVPDLTVWALLDKEQLKSAITTVNERTVNWQGVPDADGRVVSG